MTLLVAVYEYDEAGDAVQDGNQTVSSSALMPRARFAFAGVDAANVKEALEEALAEVKRDSGPLLSSWRIDVEGVTT